MKKLLLLFALVTQLVQSSPLDLAVQGASSHSFFTDAVFSKESVALGATVAVGVGYNRLNSWMTSKKIQNQLGDYNYFHELLAGVRAGLKTASVLGVIYSGVSCGARISGASEVSNLLKDYSTPLLNGFIGITACSAVYAAYQRSKIRNSRQFVDTSFTNLSIWTQETIYQNIYNHTSRDEILADIADYEEWLDVGTNLKCKMLKGFAVGVDKDQVNRGKIKELQKYLMDSIATNAESTSDNSMDTFHKLAMLLYLDQAFFFDFNQFLFDKGKSSELFVGLDSQHLKEFSFKYMFMPALMGKNNNSRLCKLLQSDIRDAITQKEKNKKANALNLENQLKALNEVCNSSAFLRGNKEYKDWVDSLISAYNEILNDPLLLEGPENWFNKKNDMKISPESGVFSEIENRLSYKLADISKDGNSRSGKIKALVESIKTMVDQYHKFYNPLAQKIGADCFKEVDEKAQIFIDSLEEVIQKILDNEGTSSASESQTTVEEKVVAVV